METLLELKARLALHHARTRELIVEGVCDQALFVRLLRNAPGGPVVVRTIDTYTVPADVVQACKEDVGCRGRVVAVAYEVEKDVPVNLSTFLCTADADFDFVLGKAHSHRYLRTTGVASLETYALETVSLGDVFASLGLKDPEDPGDLIPQITGPLVDIFCLRAANQSLAWGMEWPKRWTRRLEWKRKPLTCKLETAALMEDYLSDNNHKKNLAQFDREYKRLRQVAFGLSPTCAIRGHDFAELLLAYLRRFYAKNEAVGGLNQEGLEALLRHSFMARLHTLSPFTDALAVF